MARAGFKHISSLILLLSLFSFASSAAIEFRTVLAPRQSPAATLPQNSITCADYSRAANLSTINTNSTLRGAFLRSTPEGFNAASNLLNAETTKLLSFMFNVDLNQQCSNLSALAVAEADANFTAGTVAGLKIQTAPGVDPGNLTLPVLCVLFILFMGGAGMSL
ncbi:hypothetical protein GGR57DRAFT_195518 [Xylariaceae sp. FL1272]|nr:hypothetical protein GGR57DRAFT_195518 [Xylariaceae sp. FL1272]